MKLKNKIQRVRMSGDRKISWITVKKAIQEREDLAIEAAQSGIYAYAFGGVKGNIPRLHPAVKVEHDCRLSLCRLFKELGLSNVTDDILRNPIARKY